MLKWYPYVLDHPVTVRSFSTCSCLDRITLKLFDLFNEKRNRFLKKCLFLIMILNWVYFLHITVYTHKQTVITVHKQAKWISQSTVINVTEELFICVKDVDTMVIMICCQYMTLTICCDISGFKWLVLGRWRMTNESKSDFPSLINHMIDHYYSTSFKVSHAVFQVSILTDLFDIAVPRVQRVTFIINLDSLFYSRAWLTPDLRLSVIITEHGNH